jgi:hypothetical protein
MEFLINKDNKKSFTKGLKLYIYKLIKNNLVEFEQWKNGFGLRSSFSPNEYPKQDLIFTFGESKVTLQFKNSPNRINYGYNGNFCTVGLY